MVVSTRQQAVFHSASLSQYLLCFIPKLTLNQQPGFLLAAWQGQPTSAWSANIFLVSSWNVFGRRDSLQTFSK